MSIDKLTSEQLKVISEYIESQQLTVDSLRSEIADHLRSDIEERMGNGDSFDDAWQAVRSKIPSDHFRDVESETISALGVKPALPRVFMYVSFGLMAFASLFKLMHLPGTIVLLIASLISLGASFTSSGFVGAKLYSSKDGTGRLYMVIVAIMIFFISYVMTFLLLPGGSQLKFLAVMTMLALYPFLVLFLTRKLDTGSELMVYLHKKNSHSVEKLLWTFLGFALLLKVFSVLFGYPPAVTNVLSVTIIIIAGFHFFATLCHNQYNSDIAKNTWLKVAVILSFGGFMIPGLGAQLTLTYRVVLSDLFFIVAGYLSAIRWGSADKKWLNAISFGSIILLIGYWSIMEFGWLPSTPLPITISLPVLLGLIILTWLAPRRSILKVLLFMLMAHYLYEYSFIV